MMENLPEQKPKKSGFKKFLLLLVLFLLVGAGSYVYWKYYYVFGEGVKSGYLNYAVKKGNIFKTYEGKLIQEGFGSIKTGGIASNQFEFSIEDDSIFRQLELNSENTSICATKNIMVCFPGAETRFISLTKLSI